MSILVYGTGFCLVNNVTFVSECWGKGNGAVILLQACRGLRWMGFGWEHMGSLPHLTLNPLQQQQGLF